MVATRLTWWLEHFKWYHPAQIGLRPQLGTEDGQEYLSSAMLIGVIRGIDLDLNDNQLRELIATKRNPSALEVKRIKNTPAVTILFQGMQVPN
ncbi:hypothetical protein HPB52_023121 [Rhipicephalus sanguineus]|uniref:Uncharacterized protein n=1 Tax=Rhipicephalus sanguineus TaxID=34632 RepID=A0A9D4PKF0_RHISA|nr:hypothetical protein HPB52_023121 [Rhipicephalus sanguineus]